MDEKEVYTNDGEYLGSQWVDLSGLQESTRIAVLQLIYLDKTVDYQSDELNNTMVDLKNKNGYIKRLETELMDFQKHNAQISCHKDNR